MNALDGIAMVLETEPDAAIGPDLLKELQYKADELKEAVHSWPGPPNVKTLLIELLRRFERAIDDCRLHGPEALIDLWVYVEGLEQMFPKGFWKTIPFVGDLKARLDKVLTDIGTRTVSGLLVAALLTSHCKGPVSAEQLLLNGANGTMQHLLEGDAVDEIIDLVPMDDGEPVSDSQGPGLGELSSEPDGAEGGK